MVAVAVSSLVAVAVFIAWMLGSQPPASDLFSTPILLVHGLGNDASTWKDSGYVDFLAGRGLRSGGVVKVDEWSNARIERSEAKPEESEVFVLEISDPWESLDLWAKQIAAAVREVTERTRSPRLVLVGYSAGGVAARKYLVENPDDHRVARLVTLSSPHGGSELSILAEAAKNGELIAGARWLLDHIRREQEIPDEAPLIADLVPAAGGNVLDLLNRAAHPDNVEYACIVATGVDLLNDWTTLQAAIAQTRGGRRDGTLLPWATQTVMEWLGLGTPNASGAGDGAVLVASQHLGRVDFLRRHPELLRKVVSVPADHHQALHRYRAITEAIGDSVEFLDAELMGDRVRVRFVSPLAGMVRIEAVDTAGNPLQVEPTVLSSDGDRLVASVLVKKPAEENKEIRLTVHPPEAPYPYGAVLRAAGAQPFNRVWEEQDRELLLHGAFGTGREEWRDRGGFDLQLVLSIDDRPVYRSPVFDDVPDLVMLEEHASLRFDPASSRVELSIWDADFGGAAPERIGSVVWNPGHLKTGRTFAATDAGIAVDLELLPAKNDPTIWHETPFYW